MSDKVCENQEAKPSLEIEENETKGELNESSITMVDVLQFQEDIEEESAAVLGGSDEKCCTYAEVDISKIISTYQNTLMLP